MMNMKGGGSRSKSKMRGFMCHSPASTAVCMAMDAGRSAIVPRRHDHHRTAATSTTALVLRNTRRDHEHASLINNKYNYYRPLRLDDRSALPVAVPVPVPVRHRLSNTTTAAAACDISADPSVFRNINDHPHMKLVKQMDDNNNNNYNKASSLDHLSHPPPTTSSTSDQLFQVVVMRVSLHCQGCAGKVKKHLSKMEGVTSFSVDLETKRVTVMGHVSPTGVLESISKVKKAEFWPQQPAHDQQLMIRSL